MNKTLMERARSMLNGAGLGQEFWEEVVDTACYLVNRSPSSVLEDKTPQEVWTGKKPSLSHMRVFDVMHMYMFQRRNEPSWIVNLKSASLLGIRMV